MTAERERRRASNAGARSDGAAASGVPAAVAALRNKFALNEEVFRVIFTHSPEPKPAK